jgi:hypothetical protein
MIMVYTTDLFRISIIGLIYVSLPVKVSREKYSSWVFVPFVGILNKIIRMGSHSLTHPYFYFRYFI